MSMESTSGVRPSMSTAILDTGASKSVIGKKRLEQLMRNLPDDFVKRIAWQKSETVFKIGNKGTLASLGAVFISFGRRWLRLEVVDGTTPFFCRMYFCKRWQRTFARRGRCCACFTVESVFL